MSMGNSVIVKSNDTIIIHRLYEIGMHSKFIEKINNDRDREKYPTSMLIDSTCTAGNIFLYMDGHKLKDEQI